MQTRQTVARRAFTTPLDKSEVVLLTTTVKMMDSDEDDIYPDQDDVYDNKHQSEVKMEDAEDGEEEGEEVEEDDDVRTPSS
jgi:hypothetical protein